ncbi:MAG TPA: OB-fold nucleic acid binding domain-containing protein, partial [Candidatus Eisenbacteria bacterium]|nr:OB-fold nucleic acid binding domain-containing protein [Candidatus Eisenbacteria bacterium]
ASLIAAGDTLGVFQLESPGMRNLLRMLRSRSVDETIAAVALIRPGPAGSGMKDAYVKRARGLEQARYLHPRLEPLLAESYGVLLYEEDVMAVAAALADWTLAEGDLFRRALVGAKSTEEREPVRRLFLARLAERGVDESVARAAWEDLSRFAAYAFCKAHAAGYGVLAYQAGYLKARWPAAFAVALLANHAGMYPLWVHVADAERHGVRFRLPCVNRSAEAAVLEPDGDPETGPVRLGLSGVRDLSEATRTRLLTTREEGGAFSSLADFLARARPSLTEAQNLIAAGALDQLGRTRASLRCEAQATHARYGEAEEEGAFHVRRSPVAVPELPEFEPARLRLLEWQTLGLGVRAHPVELASPDLLPAGEGPWSLEARKRTRAALGLAPAADVERRVGERVRVAGLVAAARRVATTRGDRMLFLTLDDGTGLVECTLFPDAYRRAMGRLSGLGPFVAEGRVESSHGAVTLNTEKVERYEGRRTSVST